MLTQSANQINIEELENLRAIRLLSGLQPSALKGIKDFLVERRFEKDEVIFLQDEPAETLYFIKDGCVRLCSLSPEGKEQTLCIRRPGQFFCPVPILDGGDNLATALAMTRVSLYAISRENLLTISRDYPEIISAMQTSCVKEVRRLSHLVEEFAWKGVKGRLATALLEQSAREGLDDNGTGKVNLTQQELASLVGTRQEVISRTLRIFRKEGIIEVGRGQVTVLNREGLKEYL